MLVFTGLPLVAAALQLVMVAHAAAQTAATSWICPFGMKWDSSLQVCATCTAGVCADFETCSSCAPCPSGQFTGTVPASMVEVFYACSSSASKCPAGSGKSGSSSGCSPCPANMYNDGSSGSCMPCPSGTYPNYQVKKVPGCNPDIKRSTPCHRDGAACNPMKYSVENGCNVMWKGAESCSSRCPEGTVPTKETTMYQRYRIDQTQGGQFYVESARATLNYLGGTWRNLGTEFSYIKDACLPCTNWFIIKDGTCMACNTGANDRATLNSMGNSFAFANRCIPDICPWPYVVAGEFIMNQIMAMEFYGYSASSLSGRPEYSTLPGAVCSVNIHLGGTVATISVLAVILLSTYAISIYFAVSGQDEALTITRRRKLAVGMLLTTLSPAVDFVSDIMYIVSTLFYNYIICSVTCFFLLLPMFFFWRMLTTHGVHFSFYVGKPPAFAVMDKYDSIPKALMGLAGYLPLYIINLPVSLPLFLVGHILYCCKVFPISRVSNLWLRLYTRSTKHTNSVVIILPLLQESIFEEMLTESVPQMVIQIINNTYTNVWSPLSYFSTAMSGIMILNGIWRLVYYRMYMKIAINAIPSSLSDDIFMFSSIEDGESPLGGKYTSVKRAPPAIELNEIVTAMASNDKFVDELSPLIQHHVNSSLVELRAELAIAKSEFTMLSGMSDSKNASVTSDLQAINAEMSLLKSTIEDMNQRSRLMEAQMQQFISRSSV